MFNKKDIKILNDFSGVANDMGDFFTPNDCLDCILVRSGPMKHHEFGQVWGLMAATKMTGRLCVVFYYKKTRFSKEDWCASLELGGAEFSNFIKKQFCN